MMRVKNLTAKPIGFGSVVLLPDQSAELPAGFGDGHPTVQYYMSRKWLETAAGAPSSAGETSSGDGTSAAPVRGAGKAGRSSE